MNIKNRLLYSFRLFFLLSIILSISSCNSNNLAEQNNIVSNGGENLQLAYPSYDHYPANEGFISYPAHEGTNNIKQGPDFDIERPLKEGITIVRGRGPAEVPIRLINLTRVDQVLSETIIDNDGNFIFELDQPLISGHTIGIQLGDISGTSLDQDDFVYSESYYDRPFVGILFDIAIVE